MMELEAKLPQLLLLKMFLEKRKSWLRLVAEHNLHALCILIDCSCDLLLHLDMDTASYRRR